MKVAKFGGSSLASAAQIQQVANIIKADLERRIIVVSAPGKRHADDTKVTDLLIAAAEARFANKSGRAELDLVIARYADIGAGLDLPATDLDPIVADLEERLACDPRDEAGFIDTMKAGGEDNCARLSAQYLRAQGVEAHYVNPRDGGLTLSDEPGNARVLESSYGQLRALRQRPGVTVFPGFFGYSASGRVVTFSRGGSDITGSILAAAVDADLYENFTDVDSVFVANPTLVKNPVSVAEMTYREMRELAYAGFSVFHDEALEAVFHAGIPVAIKNTNNPQAPGTRITLARETKDVPVVGIAATGGFCSVYISKYLMNREVGFGRRLLQLFEDEAIPYEHTPTGIDNISVIVRQEHFSAATEERVLRHIRTELAVDEISVERNLALVMVVGEGMDHTIGLAAHATAAFAQARVNIEMINQGSSEVSMMFGIKEEDVPATVGALYEEFYG